MNKYNFAIVISIVLLGFIGSTYGQQLTKEQIITLTNYETKISECSSKLTSVCTKPSRQSIRKEKSYIFLNNNLKNGVNTYNFQTANSTNATASGNCTSFNSTTANNTTKTNCTNSTNNANNSTTSTNSTSTSTNSTSSNPTNSTKTATNSTNTANNSTNINNNSTSTNTTSTKTNSTSTTNNNSTSTTPAKNTTNPVPPTTSQPSDSDKQSCQTAQDVYLTCIQGGYDLNNFRSSKFYDPTFQGFPQHVAQYSQNCEAQALKQSGSLAAQKALDEINGCFQGMNGVNIRPDSTQTSITSFSKYSAACKKQFSTCDKTCSDTFAQFESCVLACENTINISSGLQIKKQLKNHISKCMNECNTKTSVNKNKSAAPIFKCLASNTELTNGTVSASILALASSLVLAIFLF